MENMNFTLFLNEDLIFVGKSFNNAEESITFLSNKLFEKGYTKEGFLEAVLKREQKFPTGLYLGNINVAIPHTDTKFANKSGLAIAVLQNPVKFRRMDNPTEEIPVHIIFLLVIVEPDEYVRFLSKLTSAFGDQKFLAQVFSSEKPQFVYTLMSQIINPVKERKFSIYED